MTKLFEYFVKMDDYYYILIKIIFVYIYLQNIFICLYNFIVENQLITFIKI